MKLLYQWRIQGGAWAPPPPPPRPTLFSDKTEKCFFYFEIGPPTYLTVWMTAPPPPPSSPTPYLKGLDPPLFITERFHQFNGVFGRSHE